MSICVTISYIYAGTHGGEKKITGPLDGSYRML